MFCPSDWLGSLIEDELRAVVAWGRVQQSRSPHDPAQSTDRFSDDYSNFRSNLYSDLLPVDSKVQIQCVRNTGDWMTILISDGFTSIKARLSATAVATLEVGMGEGLGVQTTNDVFAIRKATVVSCPIGLSEDHVQLEIDQVEYLFHLRKGIGQSRPIEQRQSIRDLIDEIGKLRTQQLGLGIDEDEVQSISSSAAISQYPPSDGLQKTSPTSIISQPGSRRAGRGSLSPWSPTPATQVQFATQAPLWTKGTKPPTLEKDGVEWETGLNLSGPVAAPIQPVKRRRFSDEEGEMVSRNQAATLQSLLAGPRAQQRSPSPLPRSSPRHSHQHVRTPPAQVASTSSNLETVPLVTDFAAPVGSATPLSQGANAVADGDMPSTVAHADEDMDHEQAPSEVVVEDVLMADVDSSSAQVDETRGSPSTRVLPAVVYNNGDATKAPPSSAEVQESNAFASNPFKASSTTGRFASRPRIPHDQRRLLEKPSSWFPSLPGHEFPHPNVPIGILRRWNEQAKARPQASSTARPTNDEDAATAADMEISSAEAAEPAGESSFESEEESIEWDSSPPRPSRPPNSSDERPSPSLLPAMDEVPLTAPRLPPAMEMPPDSSLPDDRSTTHTKDRVGYSPIECPTSSSPSLDSNKHSPPEQSAEKVSATPLYVQLTPLDGPRVLHPDHGQGDVRIRRQSSRPSSTSSVVSIGEFDFADSRVGVASCKGVYSPRKTNGSCRPPISAETPTTSATPQMLVHELKQPENRGDTVVEAIQFPAPSRHAAVDVETSQTSAGNAAAARGEWRRESSEHTPARDAAVCVEMSQPPAADQATAHRERRREHFNAARRQKWIESNCSPSSTATSFHQRYKAYQQAFPNDAIRPSAFAQAIATVYPSTGSKNATPSSTLGSRIPSAQSISAAQSPTLSIVPEPEQPRAAQQTPLVKSSPRTLPWPTAANTSPKSTPPARTASKVTGRK